MENNTQNSDLPYGLLLEFEGPHELLLAARRVHQAGYRHTDAYTPMPVEGLAKALGMRTTRLPFLVLLGGILGACGGYALQYWVSVIAYPHNVGGRAYNSWPAFMPVTFECTILAASLFGVLGMLALNGLPKPHHPLFSMPDFARASEDSFFLCIEASDPKYSELVSSGLLESLKPVKITEVPRTDL